MWTRIMEHVVEIVPVSQGDSCESVALQSAPGIESYRPLEGAVADLGWWVWTLSPVIRNWVSSGARFR